VRLLLDAHIAHAVADGLRRRGVEVEALGHWRGGALRAADDEAILRAAAAADWVLVTYDLQTIPERLRRWANEGRGHAGLILVDGRTIRPNDIGGLVRALLALVDERGDEDWRDRAVYLQLSTRQR
jgi:hypothetical protein